MMSKGAHIRIRKSNIEIVRNHADAVRLIREYIGDDTADYIEKAMNESDLKIAYNQMFDEIEHNISELEYAMHNWRYILEKDEGQ